MCSCGAVWHVQYVLLQNAWMGLHAKKGEKGCGYFFTVIPDEVMAENRLEEWKRDVGNDAAHVNREGC